MKYSYKLILIFCIIGLLSGCILELDDTPADAKDVLSVTGRILDHNNQPVKNTSVAFYYYFGSMLFSYTLKKLHQKRMRTVYINSRSIARKKKEVQIQEKEVAIT